MDWQVDIYAYSTMLQLNSQLQKRKFNRPRMGNAVFLSFWCHLHVDAS